MSNILISLIVFGMLASSYGAAVDLVVPAVEQTSPQSDIVVREACHQPKEVGRCFALFYRYAFNVEKRECEEFIYGGCAGNQNNFETMEDCQRECLRADNDSVTDGRKEETSTNAAEETKVVSVTEQAIETVKSASQTVEAASNDENSSTISKVEDDSQ